MYVKRWNELNAAVGAAMKDLNKFQAQMGYKACKACFDHKYNCGPIDGIQLVFPMWEKLYDALSAAEREVNSFSASAEKVFRAAIPPALNTLVVVHHQSDDPWSVIDNRGTMMAYLDACKAGV